MPKHNFCRFTIYIYLLLLLTFPISIINLCFVDSLQLFLFERCFNLPLRKLFLTCIVNCYKLPFRTRKSQRYLPIVTVPSLSPSCLHSSSHTWSNGKLLFIFYIFSLLSTQSYQAILFACLCFSKGLFSHLVQTQNVSNLIQK